METERIAHRLTPADLAYIEEIARMRTHGGYDGLVLALLAEIAALRRERDEAKMLTDGVTRQNRIIYDQLITARQQADLLRETLESCKAAISSPLNRESIVDTVWMSETETLVDHIDAVLPTPPAGGAHG